MNRTDRLYAIAEELRAAGSRGRTAAWLAAKLEVSSRTVKRDVSALQQAGVPVWAAGGPGGGYVLDAAVSLPAVAFTTAEATAIAIALAVSPQLPFAADGRSALTKLLGAMPPAARERAEELAGRVYLHRPATEAAPERSPVTRVLDEALRAGVVVVLDYLDGEGANTRRRPVEPLLYAFRNERWYLLGWCRWRRAGRWFRLDRVQAAWPTAEPVVQRDLEQVFGRLPDDVVSAAAPSYPAPSYPGSSHSGSPHSGSSHSGSSHSGSS
jgi:predicted DNA-binding transcriptional regulator YafY